MPPKKKKKRKKRKTALQKSTASANLQVCSWQPLSCLCCTDSANTSATCIHCVCAHAGRSRICLSRRVAATALPSVSYCCCCLSSDSVCDAATVHLVESAVCTAWDSIEEPARGTVVPCNREPCHAARMASPQRIMWRHCGASCGVTAAFQVVKAVWAYAKQHRLQDPNDGKVSLLTSPVG